MMRDVIIIVITGLPHVAEGHSVQPSRVLMSYT